MGGVVLSVVGGNHVQLVVAYSTQGTGVGDDFQRAGRPDGDTSGFGDADVDVVSHIVSSGNGRGTAIGHSLKTHIKAIDQTIHDQRNRQSFSICIDDWVTCR
ncbi:MAG: hypothetical protein A2535_05260 [Burkholderiales bacterium RIFOXYD2_FULL_59_8]|nr:MAG: hypothetical protein A2535_05260 [Burkholderiales bacterium RIFOXYD2_FULL_59_8]